VIGEQGVRAIPLQSGQTLTVGRSDDAHIVVDDPELSRYHAYLRYDGMLFVTDAGSSNGTVVRGCAVEPGTWVGIGPGDSVELGATTLVLEQAGMPQSDPAQAPGMDAVHRVADRVAASDISVLLLGETGVGKGVLARRIHDGSARRQARYLELDCAALPEQLLESELLGHEKGAFTGATQARPGLIEVADGGTVFLDEIGELPVSVQSKLLRVIEERKVMRLGGRTPRSTNVRFIAATNRDLSVEIAQGRFRSDLYYRLNGITLYIPPLRERRDEILPLAEHFMSQAGGSAEPRRLVLGEEVRLFLVGHDWPGNVRELRNMIQRAVVLCEGSEITVQHLFVPVSSPRFSTALPAVEATEVFRVPVRPPPLEPVAASDDVERRRILDAMERFAGNQTRVAKYLGISRTTLSARLDAYAIPRPRKRR
jgi:transcriptional regulator with PAS, ATPase and Fis domain